MIIKEKKQDAIHRLEILWGHDKTEQHFVPFPAFHSQPRSVLLKSEGVLE